MPLSNWVLYSGWKLSGFHFFHPDRCLIAFILSLNKFRIHQIRRIEVKRTDKDLIKVIFQFIGINVVMNRVFRIIVIMIYVVLEESLSFSIEFNKLNLGLSALANFYIMGLFINADMSLDVRLEIWDFQGGDFGSLC